MDIDLVTLSNVTGFSQVGTTANTVTNGLFWGVILITIFIIAMFKLIPKTDTPSAIAVSSFICFGLSLFLLYLQWISIFYTIGFAIMVAGSLFAIKYSN